MQKRWEAVGAIPRAKSKEVNKRFWSAFKTFFNSKGVFFKQLHEVRNQNLELKKELVKQVMELKTSKDWDKTARYMLSRTLHHGRRRSEEMEEVAKTVADAGLAPTMSEAIVVRQRWAGELGTRIFFVSLGMLCRCASRRDGSAKAFRAETLSP